MFSVGFWAFSVGCLVVDEMHMICIGFVTDFSGSKMLLKIEILEVN